MYSLKIFTQMTRAALLLTTASTFAFAGDTFKPRAYYTIGSTVDNKDVVLTFIVPENVNSITNSASKSSTELLPLKNGEKAQLWQLHNQEGIKGSPTNNYIIYSKVTEPDSKTLTGTLLVYNRNGNFSDDDDHEFHDQNNKVTVGSAPGTERVWEIVKQPSGNYKISSLFGTKSVLNQKGGTYGWRQERALEAVKTPDGKIKLRHRPFTGASSQLWKITPAGY